jgi:apolipoprotein N-acyltransferase
MQLATATPSRGAAESRTLGLIKAVRAAMPSPLDCVIALVSAVLLILSFPNFDLWPLAWVGLVPLLVLVARRKPWPVFFAGWLFAIVFFYATCYWLTYSMINFGGFPTLLAYAMLVPGAVVIGIFPALALAILAWTIKVLGTRALFLAPLLWATFEWLRLQGTGQLWNAIGYSQAFHPSLLGPARWGGVYAVGFLIVLVNAALAFALVQRCRRAYVIAGCVLLVTTVVIGASRWAQVSPVDPTNVETVVVVAIQPNVPMDLVKSVSEMRRLADDHFVMSEAELKNVEDDGTRRLVIWPESPMYFTYGSDQMLRERIAEFARKQRTFLLLNSQELAGNQGLYNSAVLINEEGNLVAQYDKIRLLPFGEYVPIPRWFPGSGLITAIVGEFTPGTEYRQMQVGHVRAGVFICIESAYPQIVRRFTAAGADVLINISNDGYLGPTAVARQHLANAVFRAVENGRPVLRVTNTGITAYITPAGQIQDPTPTYERAVRVWKASRAPGGLTPYARYGDWFVLSCGLVSLLISILAFVRWRGGRRTQEGK